MKRVLCLYRVSTKGQVDKKDDIPMQRRECMAFIERMEDWCFYDELMEKGVSGYKVSASKRDAILEILREKALCFLSEEIPHGIAVTIESMKERETPNGTITDIEALIYCERKSHKGIIIGKGGAMLKKIATAAREELEAFLNCRVNLQCWVKVKEDWRNEERMLRNFGFTEER